MIDTYAEEQVANVGEAIEEQMSEEENGYLEARALLADNGD